MQKHDGNDNFSQLRYLRGTKDNNLMSHLDGKLRHKQNNNDMKNDLLNIMGDQGLREKLAVVRDCKFFLIMADEGTGISNKEQLSFSVWTRCDNLNIEEDFLSFYEIEKIKSETVFNAIKDILLRCSLSLDDCQCQAYNEASNMMSKHAEISTKISTKQPKAIETHCQGH